MKKRKGKIVGARRKLDEIEIKWPISTDTPDLYRAPIEQGIYLPAGYYTRGELENYVRAFPRSSWWSRLKGWFRWRR